MEEAPDNCPSCNCGTAKCWALVQQHSSRINPYKDYYCRNCGDFFCTKERDDSRIRVPRDQLLLILGRKCACSESRCCHGTRICGFKDKRALEFDHIHGEGYGHRFKNQRNGRIFYRFYVEHPELAKKELQIMCRNCNKIKAVINKEYSRRRKKRIRDNLALL